MVFDGFNRIGLVKARVEIFWSGCTTFGDVRRSDARASSPRRRTSREPLGFSDFLFTAQRVESSSASPHRSVLKHDRDLPLRKITIRDLLLYVFAWACALGFPTLPAAQYLHGSATTFFLFVVGLPWALAGGGVAVLTHGRPYFIVGFLLGYMPPLVWLFAEASKAVK